MDGQEFAERVADIASELEDLVYQAQRSNVDFDESSNSLDEWKRNVIANLPKGCSVGFRMKVEEMLENIKEVY